MQKGARTPQQPRLGGLGAGPPVGALHPLLGALAPTRFYTQLGGAPAKTGPRRRWLVAGIVVGPVWAPGTPRRGAPEAPRKRWISPPPFGGRGRCRGGNNLAVSAPNHPCSAMGGSRSKAHAPGSTRALGAWVLDPPWVRCTHHWVHLYPRGSTPSWGRRPRKRAAPPLVGCGKCCGPGLGARGAAPLGVRGAAKTVDFPPFLGGGGAAGGEIT